MALQLRAFFPNLNIIDATEVNARYGGYLVLTGKIGQTDLLANFLLIPRLLIVREVIALLLRHFLSIFAIKNKKKTTTPGCKN